MMFEMEKWWSDDFGFRVVAMVSRGKIECATDVLLAFKVLWRDEKQRVEGTTEIAWKG